MSICRPGQDTLEDWLKDADIGLVTSDPANFYGLDSESLDSWASRAPRRKLAPGQADIAGRIRVNGILKEAGVPGGSPSRISGSTNEVWASGQKIVRISFEQGGYRLRREAALSTLLSPDVRYPPVLGAGVAPFGEWLVLEKISGSVLSEQWLHLDVAGQRRAIHDLAQIIRSLHSTELTPLQITQLWPAKINSAGRLLSDEEMYSHLDKIEEFSNFDKSLIADARALVAKTSDAFDDDVRPSLVHGDLHLENVLSDRDCVTALLDLEWAHPGVREEDIDTIARFCVDPELHISGGYQVDANSFRDVLRWFAEAYPEIFEHPRVVDRLTRCALSYELPAVVESPPTSPSHKLPKWYPINRLRDLVNLGPTAEILGW